MVKAIKIREFKRLLNLQNAEGYWEKNKEMLTLIQLSEDDIRQLEIEKEMKDRALITSLAVEILLIKANDPKFKSFINHSVFLARRFLRKEYLRLNQF